MTQPHDTLEARRNHLLGELAKWNALYVACRSPHLEARIARLEKELADLRSTDQSTLPNN